MNTGPRVLQPQHEANLPIIHEDPTQQRLQRTAASQQQCTKHVTGVETKVEQLRHDFCQAMVESALALQTVVQQVRGQGQGIEQIHHTLYNVAMDKLDGLDARFQKCCRVLN